MLGFTARADGASEVRPDKVEMAEAGWFTRDAGARRPPTGPTATQSAMTGGRAGAGVLHAIPPQLSISRFLIDTWLAGGARLSRIVRSAAPGAAGR